MQKIPEYIKETLSRAAYDYRPNTTPGYSIAIHKRTRFCRISTLMNEVGKLISWADRNTPEGLEKSRILFRPTENHHCDQFAVVTIYDPVMKELEPYIKDKKK